ncbi:MAG: hypothetical protein CMO80_14055 [Verrucomicrobiales bacterium]|nr:hypothetical protein [Verrucomicrobiales bacterium]
MMDGISPLMTRPLYSYALGSDVATYRTKLYGLAGDEHKVISTGTILSSSQKCVKERQAKWPDLTRVQMFEQSSHT